MHPRITARRTLLLGACLLGLPARAAVGGLPTAATHAEAPDPQ